jgi:O-succinylbenzoate synthase
MKQQTADLGTDTQDHTTILCKDVEQNAFCPAPFATFTWQGWMQAQARAAHCFQRFLQAVESQRPDRAFAIGLELQEVTSSLLLEAYAQCAADELQLPGTADRAAGDRQRSM